jgi:hypothetical protein
VNANANANAASDASNGSAATECLIIGIACWLFIIIVVVLVLLAVGGVCFAGVKYKQAQALKSVDVDQLAGHTVVPVVPVEAPEAGDDTDGEDW